MTYKAIKEKASQEKSLQDITPKFLAWEKPKQSVLGRFVSCAPVQSGLSEGQYNQYLFDTDDGMAKFSLGGAADKEFSTLLVPGNVYEITYLGKEKIARGRSVNKFTLVLVAAESELPPGEASHRPF
jgi:hypothetical protein